MKPEQGSNPRHRGRCIHHYAKPLFDVKTREKTSPLGRHPTTARNKRAFRLCAVLKLSQIMGFGAEHLRDCGQTSHRMKASFSLLSSLSALMDTMTFSNQHAGMVPKRFPIAFEIAVPFVYPGFPQIRRVLFYVFVK